MTVLHQLNRAEEVPVNNLLTQDRQKILFDWNDTAFAFPREQSLQQQFERIVEQYPENIALTFRSQNLTYRELNRRTNKLASQLRAQGVGLETFVAILMDRSFEMIVATLAVLKAGGCYVPLDPAYPQERIEYMLGDTQAPILLTQSHLAQKLPAHSAKVIFLDAAWGAETGEETANLNNINNGQSLAYVMYTSGSTGKPKGVMIRHQSVMRLIVGANFARLNADTVILQLAPVSFDASTLEIWGALLTGGRCVLYPENGAPKSKDLQKVLQENHVNVMWLTASLFNVIVSEAPETLQGVAQVLTGGEVLSVAHIRRASEHLAGTELINGYGPTECTTFSTTYSIPLPLPAEWTSIPIGRPIVNTQVYILNRDLQPVPVGESGELYIGGLGVARGYLNQPKLTAERFIPNPFTNDPEDILYKSGDVVRYLEDGRIDFIGREDDQVKVRGFRIELGEIEAQLLRHDCVRNAKVVVNLDEAGNKRLVAYVVQDEDQAATVSELRRFLGVNLPDYMIPSLFVFMEMLPLTANGKLDHNALPAPGRQRPNIDQPYAAPRNKVERWLAKMWQELLNLDKVGVQDRFFELGGDSLRAGQFISQVQRELEIEIPLIAIYEAFSIEKFAALLEQDYGEAVAAHLDLRRRSDRKTSDDSGRSSRLERRKQRFSRH